MEDVNGESTAVEPRLTHGGAQTTQSYEKSPPPLDASSIEGYITEDGAYPTLDQTMNYELMYGKEIKPNMDEMKIRKMISNRLSAKKCRLNQAKHMVDLEKNLKDAEATIATLLPQIEHEKEYQSIIRIENNALGKELETLSEIDRVKMAQTEETRAEIKKLKDLMSQQQEQQQLIMGREDFDSRLEEIASMTYYLEYEPQPLTGMDLELLDGSSQIPDPNPTNINAS